MPVRLNAFPIRPNNRRPVYITQQKNEALYFRLDGALVRRWLRANDVALPADFDDKTLGASYLEAYDLAFVVYRKGMTPDLGDISAMWRNHSADFLCRILDQRMLRCGSGSLCDTRGGACPACVMVSEVTCICGNQLLSRSSLKGGPAPAWQRLRSVPF